MRLIDADALMDDIKAANENGGMGYVIASTLKRYVKRLPTIDAVPVVRCVECIKYNNYKRPNVGYGYCEELHTVMGDEDFCSLGTRREEAEENGSD